MIFLSPEIFPFIKSNRAAPRPYIRQKTQRRTTGNSVDVFGYLATPRGSLTADTVFVYAQGTLAFVALETRAQRLRFARAASVVYRAAANNCGIANVDRQTVRLQSNLEIETKRYVQMVGNCGVSNAVYVFAVASCAQTETNKNIHS